MRNTKKIRFVIDLEIQNDGYKNSTKMLNVDIVKRIMQLNPEIGNIESTPYNLEKRLIMDKNYEEKEVYKYYKDINSNKVIVKWGEKL